MMNRRNSQSSTPGTGIPVTVRRDGDRVSIRAAGFGEVSDRLSGICDQLRSFPEPSFRVTGALTIYRGWTIQPREVCERFLEESDPPAGVRPLLILDDIASLGEDSLEALPYADRFRTLVDRFPDSELIQKRSREADSSRCEDGEDERVIATEQRESEHTDDKLPAPAVDVLYSCGYLDLEGVESRLGKMQQRLEARDTELAGLRERLADSETAEASMKPLVELGRSCLERLAQEAVSRLRAIQLHRGEGPRDAARLGVLQSSDSDPAVVREIHRSVTEEFHALYPTGPCSVPGGCEGSDRVRWDWDVFRIAHPALADGKDSGSRKF